MNGGKQMSVQPGSIYTFTGFGWGEGDKSARKRDQAHTCLKTSAAAGQEQSSAHDAFVAAV